jgi:hypothetical protein
LRKHEQNYSTHDLELVVVVHALKIWRHYIMGTKCQIYTDPRRLCEDDVQAVAPINEGLREEHPVDYGVNDQRVGPWVRYVDPMIFPRENDWELRPTQRLWSFSVDVPNLPCV